MVKLSKTQSGISGEYLVAGKLTLYGFQSAITLRNNEEADILASNSDTGKLVKIQVKTSQNKRRWPMSKKHEVPIANLFFVFVNIVSHDNQEYFIISSSVLAKLLKDGYDRWLVTPNKKGENHNPTNMREFNDLKGLYLNRWDLLNE